ncbi:polyphosphate kinase 2 [Empedobacter falsenii]|uniref:ADP/GDP-polyphosphate phosphotransferase n=2 Tax=Weeksellaceae TaxID=2762318 RepID=A0A427BTH0_9FLAO|nr:MULTISPECIES: polyphosphate kinase 2 [Empedobacter]MBW1619366.1 polyphosphate kinase 2 [Empedobacter falsenii]MDH0659915.1 polyphosphate kinase 2 [Empedobacter sp. GD03865]MDH0674734.1 polyphosphate kinase 2 [Empedobacter sp. GD03861]MDH1601608.1 polyphosphate kinase 2 [Empedobacter sp. GD03739]MDM1139737.1 polyphosphate kinase 2 [Empedobacter sp. R132-2]
MKKSKILDFTTTEELMHFLVENQEENPLYKNVIKKFEYENELLKLQSELVNLQNWISTEKKKVAIIFEGRDASGKGGTIRRFREHLNPRSMRVVALNKPTEVEQNQWYFNRYIKELPNAGEIVFFDRSWYNRAVVEPVMGFCTEQQYEQFMVQVSEFEHMLYESGTYIVKLWFSVTKEEQQTRFDSRLNNPLKKWKYSPVDAKGQELWDEFSHYINQMFTRTHNSFSPWIIVNANDKNTARLESIRYVLSLFNYKGKEDAEVNLMVDPNVIERYYRMVKELNH